MQDFELFFWKYIHMYFHVNELFHHITLFVFFPQSKYKENNTGTRFPLVQLIRINLILNHIMENISLKI